jgi:hypothetical protein
MLTLGLPGITGWLDSASGVHNLETLLRHQLGLIACVAGLVFCAQMARPELVDRWRRALLAALLAAQLGLVATFSALPHRTEAPDYYQDYPGSTAACLHTLIGSVFMGAAMVAGCWLFGRHVRRTTSRSLCAGLLVLALGTAAGTGYAALRICQSVLERAGRPMFLDERGLYRLEWSSFALLLLGSLLPTVGVALRGLRDCCTARRLRPLWRELTAAVPEVVLTERLGRGPRLKLHRLAIEIRDAALVLAGHAGSGLRDQAAASAAATAPAGPERAALEEACWLRGAVALRRAGHTPEEGAVPARADSFEELDFATETDRLRRLATAYSSPAARAVARAAVTARTAAAVH